jgi:hypothetical protein
VQQLQVPRARHQPRPVETTGASGIRWTNDGLQCAIADVLRIADVVLRIASSVRARVWCHH